MSDKLKRNCPKCGLIVTEIEKPRSLPTGRK